MEAVRTISLTKYYGKSRGIKDINLAVPEGDFFGFIGPNGAGKSTTIRTLLGLISPSSGTAEIFGQDIRGHKDKILSDIGYMPSEANFYPAMKVREVIRFSAELRGRDCSVEAARLCERLELDTGKKIGALSLGNRKKVSIVCALQHKPKLCIFDEPTSGLDPLIRSQLLKILTDYMSKGGKGVFFSTHITSDLDKIADMLIMIDNGSIVFQEEKDTLLDTYRIVKGDVRALTPDMRKLFLNVSETAFGFTGITKQAAEVQRLLPDAMIERPTIEDIMLGNIEGGNK